MRNSRLNKKAFSILTDDEKASLALQQVHGKSTWQAGEIMKKSHYKYLEINQRAKRFVELFQTHYNDFGGLIPDNLTLDPIFQAYLVLTIEKRLTVKNAAIKTGDDSMANKKHRDAFIIEHLTKLGKHPSLQAQGLYKIVMEFDRYNNFRILPSDIQEPSAFKRRNKTRFKKHLTTSLTLTPYVLDRVIELFETKSKTSKNIAYVVLADESWSTDPVILKVLATPDNIKALSSISIYIFNSITTANDYKELVSNYLTLVTNSPREGLKFWPRYRTIIKEAINFSEVNNIVPSRKHIVTTLKFMDLRSHAERANQRLTQALTQ